MYAKVDYSTEAKKNPRPNMGGQYAIYTKRHWWNKWVERGTYADLDLCIQDAKKLIELPKYYNNKNKIMKKLLSIMICLFMAISANAQTDTLNVETQEVYCMVVGEGRLFSNKCTITIDFGQKTNFWAGSSQMKMVDENGKTIKFNSLIDACNYVASLGWTFVDAYAMIDKVQGNCYHYIFKKVVNKGEQVEFNVKRNRPNKVDKDDLYSY